MRRASAINHPPVNRQDRRRLLLGLAALAALCPAAALASDDEKKEKKKKGDAPVEKPPINTPTLVVEAVTAPIVGPPGSKVIMTLTVDCGSVENARVVDNLMPRVYNAVIMELNREPLGKNGRIYDADIEGLKRRLVFQINRALQGPQVVGVYIRSMQEVPLRPPPRS